MTQINAFLTFNGNCREAMTFYKDCFGGELTLLTVKDSPMANQWPAQAQDNILHGYLANGNIVLLGSDIVGSKGIVKGNTVSLSVNCSSEEEMQNFFTWLSSGAHNINPIHDFFAGQIGEITDKFGIDWTLYHAKNSESLMEAAKSNN